MNKLKICKNKCIFCFIEQLPEGLRESLYIKDDDYLESYAHGNFITLTNLSKKDISNIIRFRIEPLHVSLHSFNINTRNILFGNCKNSEALLHLKNLDENSVRTNIQIVLCPGINDKEDLANTLDLLINDFNRVLSVGIVPVGLTKYNKNRYLKPYDANSSLDVINFIEDYKQKNKKNKNSLKIYLSDEFYILAKRKFPSCRTYGKFFQIKNGIGKSADFLDEFSKYFLKFAKINNINNLLSSPVLIMTSEYGEYILKLVLKIILDFTGHLCDKKIKLVQVSRNFNILAVKNNFLGGNVKVTGLLSGNDIIEQLRFVDTGSYKKIIIPECIFNIDGLTIDNYSRDEITAQSEGHIIICGEDGVSLAKQLF